MKTKPFEYNNSSMRGLLPFKALVTSTCALILLSATAQGALAASGGDQVFPAALNVQQVFLAPPYTGAAADAFALPTIGVGQPRLHLAQSSFSGSYDFAWNATKSDNVIALSGSVPSESLRTFLSIRAGENSTNTTSIAKGAPDTFISNAIAGLDALKKLLSGQLSVADGVWTLTGSAASEDEKSNILAVLSQAVDISDWKIDLSMMPDETKSAAPNGANKEAPVQNTNQSANTESSDTPADVLVPVQDFRWSAQKGIDGAIRFSGMVPSENLQNFLNLRAKDVSRDTMQVGEGAPAGFMNSALAAIQALHDLETGRVLFSGGQWTIYGLAADKPAFSKAMADIAGSENSLDWAVSISVKDPEEPQSLESENANEAVVKPEESSENSTESATESSSKNSTETMAEVSGDPDYQFNALRADGGDISVSGMLPTTAFANYLTKIVGEFPLERIEISPDAPDNFLIDTITGLKALSQLRSGLLAYENGQWELVGDALDSAQGDAARQMISSLSDGQTWKLDVVSVPAAQLCNIAIEKFSQTQTVLFAPASAQLTSESRQNVTALAQDLNKCPQMLVYVSGHTDADGPADANMALSVARAEAVVSTLLDAGVDEARLYAVGYGETLPIATNDTRAGKAQNRRIVFELEHKE